MPGVLDNNKLRIKIFNINITSQKNDEIQTKSCAKQDKKPIQGHRFSHYAKP